jgi:TRAP-type mannitol/chloroaromatic compound transport system substrate-binding protein
MEDDMKRRNFLKTAAAGAAAGAIGAPAIVRAQKTLNWKMTTTWPPQLPFYQSGPGSAEDIAKNIETMSDGRLRIKVYAAGELIPAFEGFDAASKGTVEMNHGVAYYWAGKRFAAQYFGTVPFGMSYVGQNAWYYHGGGLELWNEVYEPFNLIAMPCGNTGIQMGGWFRKEMKSLEDFKGLKMRIPGLAGKVYQAIGVNVKLLPGGEIFPALERGVIDAAEWVGPYQDRRLGLHKAAKYYYTSDWHEPSTTSELIVNKDAYNKLPKDLQAIIQAAARDANLTSYTWAEAHNAEALEDLVKNHGVQTRQFSKDVIDALRKITNEVLAEESAKDPLTKKVHDSFYAFKKRHDTWGNLSEAYFLSIR